MQGTYLLTAIILVAFIVWPQESVIIATTCSLKIQIHVLNLRMKWTAWRLYRQLVRMTKEAGFPHPGPFKYKNLWERD